MTQDSFEAKNAHFNSIKVRLEQTHKYRVVNPHQYFNSIKVRLELIAQSALFAAQRFQFHKGTIRTAFQICVHPQNRDFNSIKVRLEQQEIMLAKWESMYFNSIKVRLERILIFLRLLLILFQFHKGTIRTFVCS